MKFQKIVATLIILLFFNCEKDSELSKTIDLEQFKIEVPENWTSIPKQGNDSKVGVISNGEDELSYDYGWYSYSFDNETSDTHTRTNTTIDGKPALIVQPKEKGNVNTTQNQFTILETIPMQVKRL